MEKAVKITTIVAVAIVLVALMGFYFSNSNFASGKTVSAEGRSSLKVVPDLVTIYFNVETNGTDAKSAKDANSEVVDKLVTSLIKLGFNREDIQTQSFNIYENTFWENNKYVTKGYKASHQIKLVLNTTQTTLIADVIDAGVDSGALLSYINFELSSAKQSEYKIAALKEAGVDAKAKAGAIAEGLGKNLGSLVSVSSSDFSYNPWNVYSARADLSAGMVAEEAKLSTTNIVPGSQEVSAVINVVYKLR